MINSLIISILTFEDLEGMNIFTNNAMRGEQQTPKLKLSVLLNIFRNVVGGDRFGNLYAAISKEIKNLGIDSPVLLDYGCGIMNFSSRLKAEERIFDFVGMDIYPSPISSEVGNELWMNYRQINKEGVASMGMKFDISIVVDVLHHANEKDHLEILNQLASCSEFILIKDHFEYSYLSRQLLRLADWYGNYAYGISIPRRYFSPKRWSSLVADSGLQELRLTNKVRVHDGLFGLIIPPRLHFISILVNKNWKHK